MAKSYKSGLGKRLSKSHNVKFNTMNYSRQCQAEGRKIYAGLNK